ncbi:MAG: hypothetical protein M0R03_19650 [Novosphingobium sp.]|nr:hypothetical protein [Novosphingobium sp.]
MMTEQLPVPQDETAITEVEPVEEPRRNPAGKAVRFVREHPVAAVAGAAVAGVVLAAFVPKRNRERIANSKIAGKASHLFELATVAGLALGRDVMERAESAGHELRSRGGDLAHRAERLGHHAADRASRLSDAATDRFEQITARGGKAASSTGHRIADKAAEIAKRLHR